MLDVCDSFLLRSAEVDFVVVRIRSGTSFVFSISSLRGLLLTPR